MRHRVLFLADISSTHTRKWVSALSDNDIEIKVFSLKPINAERFSKEEVKQFSKFYFQIHNEVPFTLISTFIQAFFRIKKIIKEFKPDIIHSHYATSYGFLGALTNFHPYVISVWGSDIFSFPQKSFLHKFFLRNNLEKADEILSTSKAMAEEAKKYTSKKIVVTPFGIDLETFKPEKVKNVLNDGSIVIGTVKQLEIDYGISELIKAFAILKEKNTGIPLKLLIVGSGSQIEALKALAQKLNIDTDTVFTGFIPPDKVAEYHNMLSISVFPSLHESFGVSVVEASACAKPVVASNVGGLPEVVENGVTGILVPPSKPEELARAIERLVLDEGLRTKMGENGRKRVEKYYNWNDCVKQMIGVYDQILKGKDTLHESA